ncbi:MAG: hypothetical protein AAGG55_03710 [Pseudomonadota bacterium]
MLTEGSYQGAIWVYVLSAIFALVLFNFWMLRERSWGLRTLLTLPLATLLLIPAYIEAGAETLAPALIVLAFQWLSAGQEAAEHALRPLLLFTAVALVPGVLWCLIALLFGRGRADAASEGEGHAA